MRLQMARRTEGKDKETNRDAPRGRQRYTAIQTLLFHPSLIGKASTVSPALKLDIDPVPPPPPPLALHTFPSLSFSPSDS